jgi:NADH:ubiquinone oxidoreductase subunit 5 (subunit L)/multisubunit Na+/H+ antiporter MnhA subunit
MYLLIIFSPLYSFFTLIFFGKFLGKKGSIIISCLLLLISFFINLISFFEVVLSNTVVLCKLEII